jgi:hypothetical protein
MLTQMDAALIANARRGPWPSPQDYPLPIPLEARTSATKLLASGLFALGLAGMIALMLYDNAQSAEAHQGWRLWIRILAGLGIAGLGIAILVAGVQALMEPKALTSLAPTGLLVPSLYDRAVPWSEIMLVVHDKPRVKIFGPGRIVMGIRNGGHYGRMTSQDLKPAFEPGGLDAVQLPQMLDIPVEGLFARIQAYRAHFGRGGAPGTSE